MMMGHDWWLVALLVAISVPGAVVVAWRSVDGLSARISSSATQRPLPPRGVLVLLGSLQSMFLLTVLATLGLVAARATGVGAPLFAAAMQQAGLQLSPALIGSGALPIGAAAAEPLRVPAVLLRSLIVSALVLAVFLPLYYGVIRQRLDAHTVAVTEQGRLDLGLAGRVLYGGIYEEVLTRWGLLGGLLWVGRQIAGALSPPVVWTAIVVAGVLFGLGHLPNAFAAGARRSVWLVVAALALNLAASLGFGWLFWQYGLLSAILAHALLHVVWHPLELRLHRAGSRVE